MALCTYGCAVDVPQPLGGGCAPSTRNGGISNLVFLSCDVVFTDVRDLNEWCDYIGQGKATASLDVVGQKPKATATKKKTSSCRNETITGFDYSLTFQDYNADNENFADFDFWNTIQTNYQRFQVGFITCDGCLYGFMPTNPNDPNDFSGNFLDTWSIEVSNVIEDDFNGSSYWDGSVEWKGKYEAKPICIPGLANVINSGGAGCGNFPPPPPSVVCVSFRVSPVSTSVNLGIATVVHSLAVNWGDCTGKVDITAVFTDIAGDAYGAGEITNITVNGVPGSSGSIAAPQSPLKVTFDYDTAVTPNTDIVGITLIMTSPNPDCCFPNGGNIVLATTALDGAPGVQKCVAWQVGTVVKTQIANIVSVQLPIEVVSWYDCVGKINASVVITDVNGDAYANSEILNITTGGIPGLSGSLNFPFTPLVITYDYDVNVTPVTDAISVVATLIGVGAGNTCCLQGDTAEFLNLSMAEVPPPPLCLSDPSFGYGLPYRDGNFFVVPISTFWNDNGPCGDVINITDYVVTGGTSALAVTLKEINGGALPAAIPASNAGFVGEIRIDMTDPNYVVGDILNFAVSANTPCCIIGTWTEFQLTMPCPSPATGVITFDSITNVNTDRIYNFTITWNWGNCLTPILATDCVITGDGSTGAVFQKLIDNIAPAVSIPALQATSTVQVWYDTTDIAFTPGHTQTIFIPLDSLGNLCCTEHVPSLDYTIQPA